MEVLGTLGIIVGLLCSFGIFLDKHHFEQSTIEKVRNHLIALGTGHPRLFDGSTNFMRKATLTFGQARIAAAQEIGQLGCELDRSH